MLYWRDHNIENFVKKFNRQWKLAGPQHREIGTPISTGNGSWRGPNTEKLEPQFQQAMEVGDGAPNIEADGKSDFNNVRVGGVPT